MSVCAYNEETLSSLFQYSFQVPKCPGGGASDLAVVPQEMVTVTHSVVAQLSVGGLVGVADSSPSSATPTESWDVGPLLTQVHDLGPFKAGGLAVSGNRRTAAVVSQYCYNVAS